MRSALARNQMIPSFTDSSGNRSALNKLMSNKYASSAMVMELACYLKREFQRARTEGAGLPDRTRAQKRRRLEDRLRVKDPW